MAVAPVPTSKSERFWLWMVLDAGQTYQNLFRPF